MASMAGLRHNPRHKFPFGSEIKLDGYRALAVKNASGIDLFSRRRKSLSKKFPYFAKALADLPAGTILDGELVGLDDNGRPDFNLLQYFRGGSARITSTSSIRCAARVVI